MNVELLSVTPNALNLIATAACRCYSPNDEISLQKREDEKADYIEKILKRGHTSILEHVAFTFHITGISRVTTHQLVRHRMASYAQQSLRYTKAGDPSVVIPKAVQNNTGTTDIFNSAVLDCYRAYGKLLEAGIKPEDARYILPMGIRTNIVVTMNCRELYETFFPLRMCRHAQWEIRELAQNMYIICMRELSAVFQFTGPQCKLKGYCTENDTKCPFNKMIEQIKNP